MSTADNVWIYFTSNGFLGKLWLIEYLNVHYITRVQANQRHNKMGVANLAIVFGPTLMGGDQGAATGVPSDTSKLADMHWQVKVVETILENYRLIFEPDDEWGALVGGWYDTWVGWDGDFSERVGRMWRAFSPAARCILE